MLRMSWPHAVLMGICIALLVTIPLPASAYNVATYGTSAGFDPSLHTDSVFVVESIPGSSGTDLDAAVNMFTQPSVDVMILGGNASFSPASAAKIEAAVAAGKILVVVYPCNRLFNNSLPASNGGTVPGSSSLGIASPASAASLAIFQNLPSLYPVQGTIPDREQAVPKSGSDILLSYNNGLPALLSWEYGNGTVIEWTTKPVPSYLTGTEADTITSRMLTRLLPGSTPVPTTVSPLTSVTTEPQATVTPAIIPSAVLSVTPTGGNVVVYSSPSGASILIDGIYSGTTPANLTGILQGNHILRLTLSGYYDYEGTIYIVPGQTASAFGTLPPLNQYTSAMTPIPTETTPVITMVTPTVTPKPQGLLDNSSIVVAIFGIFTALIAAGVTIFTVVHKGAK